MRSSAPTPVRTDSVAPGNEPGPAALQSEARPAAKPVRSSKAPRTVRSDPDRVQLMFGRDRHPAGAAHVDLFAAMLEPDLPAFTIPATDSEHRMRFLSVVLRWSPGASW